jgi:hypothetical protein
LEGIADGLDTQWRRVVPRTSRLQRERHAARPNRDEIVEPTSDGGGHVANDGIKERSEHERDSWQRLLRRAIARRHEKERSDQQSYEEVQDPDGERGRLNPKSSDSILH